MPMSMVRDIMRRKGVSKKEAEGIVARIENSRKSKAKKKSKQKRKR